MSTSSLKHLAPVAVHFGGGGSSSSRRSSRRGWRSNWAKPAPSNNMGADSPNPAAAKTAVRGVAVASGAACAVTRNPVACGVSAGSSAVDMAVNHNWR